MFLLEPTVMCCFTLLFHGSSGMQVLGVFSLVLCLAVPVAVWAHIRPSRFDAAFVKIDEHDESAAEGGVNLLLQLFERQYKWTDLETAGYCRSNRMLFCDYKSRFYRFIVAEMAMCIVTGALEGSQSGSGRCVGVMVGLVLAFAVYSVALVALRPYNEFTLFLFSATTSILQGVAATTVFADAAWGWEGGRHVADIIVLALSYFMLLNLFLTLYPRVRMIASWGAKRMRPSTHQVYTADERCPNDEPLLDLQRMEPEMEHADPVQPVSDTQQMDAEVSDPLPAGETENAVPVSVAPDAHPAESGTSCHEGDDSYTAVAVVDAPPQGAVRRIFTRDATSRALYDEVDEMLHGMRADHERERLREEQERRKQLLDEDDILAGPVPAPGY